jgi:hypothetical protein
MNTFKLIAAKINEETHIPQKTVNSTNNSETFIITLCYVSQRETYKYKTMKELWIRYYGDEPWKVYYTIIIFSGGIIFAIVFSRYKNKEVVELELNTSFSGVVTKKFKDESRHGQETIIVEENEYEIHSHDLYMQIDIGDTVIKNNKTFKYKLIKNGDTLSYFPSLGSDVLKDK